MKRKKGESSLKEKSHRKKKENKKDLRATKEESQWTRMGDHNIK